MAEITTIGLDIAKTVFQVHGVDADGEEIVRRRLCIAPSYLDALGSHFYCRSNATGDSIPFLASLRFGF